MNNMISIKVPIIDAMELCGADHDKDIPVFTRWATLAEKDIGSFQQFEKKIAVLDINGCVACLPSDAAYVQRAVLGDFGCDCTDLFARFCTNYPNRQTDFAASPTEGATFLVVDIGSGNNTSYTYVPHSVQDNKLIFENNFNGQKVTIQYLAYMMDCDGFLKISENHVQAITYAILWKYYMRKKRKSNDDFFLINKYRAEWTRECANARAKDGELTESERARIAQMLHDPYIGIGLSVGMYPTLGNYIW